jgi:uncharacterized protein (DUF3084 family)
MSISEAIRNWVLSPVMLKLTEMENNLMAQIDDLNAAIQAEDVEVSTLAASITKIDSDVDALLAAVKAGATPTDLTTQIQAIQSHTSALATAVAQLAAEDTKANTPPAA